MHVCDELHYTSPIGLSQGPRHSSVHRHKASWWNCLLLTIRRTRSPLKQHPRGRAAWGAPRGASQRTVQTHTTHLNRVMGSPKHGDTGSHTTPALLSRLVFAPMRRTGNTFCRAYLWNSVIYMKDGPLEERLTSAAKCLRWLPCLRISRRQNVFMLLTNVIVFNTFCDSTLVSLCCRKEKRTFEKCPPFLSINVNLILC